MSVSTVNAALSSNRRGGGVENGEFAAFARRIVRAYARRVADGDVEALRELVTLAVDLEQSTKDAVVGLHEFGYSWAEIGARLGMTRQGVRQRWGIDRETSGGALDAGPATQLDLLRDLDSMDGA